MKSLLSGLLIISSLQIANAASTDILKDVQQKVVELHITHKPSVEDLKKKTKAGILNLGKSICSGAFVTSSGDILTARHCADDVQAIEVILADGREYRASVIALSERHDLALLHIDALNTPHFKLAEHVYQGQMIYTYGSPLGIGGTMSQGIVAKLTGDENLIDCSVLPGNSGGPLFDEDGKLVGITTAGFIVLYGTTHLNIAQSLEAIVFFAVQVGRGQLR